jgi:sirohydrochlorin cobaltochelatase
MQAVVVFAHGSRDPLWRGPIEAVADAVRARSPSTPVVCAYLELCEPSLPAAIGQLAALGATRVRVLPVFFGMGRHAREDLPGLLAGLSGDHPTLHFEVLPTVGEDPRVTQLLAQLALENTA